MFKEGFGEFVCVGDSIQTEVEGFLIVAEIFFADDAHIDDDDCHNTDQSITGCDDEQQEKLLEARGAWENNEWFYCGVVLHVYKNGIQLSEHAASLWRIEANYPNSDNSNLTEVANEMLPEALSHAKTIIKTLVEA